MRPVGHFLPHRPQLQAAHQTIEELNRSGRIFHADRDTHRARRGILSRGGLPPGLFCSSSISGVLAAVIQPKMGKFRAKFRDYLA